MEGESSLNQGLPLCLLCACVFFCRPWVEAFEAIGIKEAFVSCLSPLASTHPAVFSAGRVRSRVTGAAKVRFVTPDAAREHVQNGKIPVKSLW